MSKLEKIGKRYFWAETYAPPLGIKVDAEFSHNCDTDEIQLVLNLGTTDGPAAIAKARDILRLLAVAERQPKIRMAVALRGFLDRLARK